MGYKRMKSAVHNLAHSFLSLANYVDGGYVLDELHDELRRHPSGISINSVQELSIRPRRPVFAS
jgi:hypothetical protein